MRCDKNNKMMAQDEVGLTSRLRDVGLRRHQNHGA